MLLYPYNSISYDAVNKYVQYNTIQYNTMEYFCYHNPTDKFRK